MQTDDKQRVLAAADIVKVIGDHVTLKPKGREKVCLCPFHDDRNPSMYVVPHKQMYHCFVCGAGGDVITFVMEYHKMGFGEALEYLADRFGVKLTPWQPRSSGGGEHAEGPSVSREQLAQANAAAQAYFRAILRHPEHGAAARAIIERRKISPEMVERFGLGTSADRWDGLLLYLQSKKADIASFQGAGLLKSREYGGGLYDALRNRITFPIHDMLGRVIGFGARRIDDADEPKYLNSPETGLFNKSATLYAIHLAADAIRKENRAVVCEGYMDAIACHQAGVCNVVATLGTALTSQSARVLQRLCDTVVLLFDGDEAGQRAADRAIEVLFGSTLDVKIATLANVPPINGVKAKDPDELVKLPGGVEALRSALDVAVDALDYRYTRLKAEWAGLNLSAKAQAVESELQRLVELGLNVVSPVRKQMIIRRIGEISGVDEITIRRVISSAAGKTPGRVEPEMVRAGSGPVLRSVFEHIVACMLCDDKVVATCGVNAVELATMLTADRFERGEFAIIAARLASHLRLGSLEGANILAEMDDSAVARAATAAIAELTRQSAGNEIQLAKHMQECVRSARRAVASQKVDADAPQAEGGGVADWAARLKLLQQANATVGRDARNIPKPTRQ